LNCSFFIVEEDLETTHERTSQNDCIFIRFIILPLMRLD
jgi:hypothetical protein